MNEPWRDWYHCIVGTYGQWLPGDMRGWCERDHHEHVPGRRSRPPVRTPFNNARLAHSQEIMRWSAYRISAENREIIGGLLVEGFGLQHIGVVALAVCEKNFHALIQISNHACKRALGAAKRHVTFRFAPIVDPVEGRHQPIWERGSLAKPIKDRAHGFSVYKYILAHRNEGAWIWSFHNHPKASTLAHAVENGGLHRR